MLSMYFLNVDGNSTNFDSFEVELSRYAANFSIIGICETNTDSENKNLYALNNYSSVYQSKIINKKSGTGLGLYIHNKYCFNERPDLNVCTSNLEALFVTISNTSNPIVVGVMYRPLVVVKSYF